MSRRIVVPVVLVVSSSSWATTAWAQTSLLLLLLVFRLVFFTGPVVHASAAAAELELENAFRNDPVYTAWLATTNYSRSLYVPTTTTDDSTSSVQGASIHWSIDTASNEIHLAMAVYATGWLGFGLAEAGGMLGADMVLYTAATNTLTDAYVLDQHVQPLVDENQQDWKLVHSIVDNEESGIIIVEMTRFLDTGDRTEDRVIANDTLAASLVPSRIIAAWGDSDTVTYHGSNRIRTALRFFESTTTTTGSTSTSTNIRTSFEETMARQAQASFVVRVNNYTIPSDTDTTYTRFCIGKAELLAQQPNANITDTTALHAIGFIANIDQYDYVHHIILYGSTRQEEDSVSGTTTECSFTSLAAFEVAFGWAPGEEPLVAPDVAGIPLFGTTGYQAFLLEIHYNNPNRVVGVVDDTAVMIYYTNQLRQYDLGVLTTGDQLVNLEGTLVGNGLTRHAFECPATCSSLFFATSGPITVIREQLHMHMTGVRMTNEQIRAGEQGGEEVIRTGFVDYWEYHQQGNYAVPQPPFQVQAGDSFRTVCYYQNDNTNSTTTFGFSSQEEMCIAFLTYYPRQLLLGQYPFVCGYGIGVSTCETTYTNQTLNSTQQLNRTFGGSGSRAATTPAPAPAQGATTTPSPNSNRSPTTPSAPGRTPTALPIQSPPSLTKAPSPTITTSAPHNKPAVSSRARASFLVPPVSMVTVFVLPILVVFS